MAVAVHEVFPEKDFGVGDNLLEGAIALVELSFAHLLTANAATRYCLFVKILAIINLKSML